jgi:hypothetical protein
MLETPNSQLRVKSISNLMMLIRSRNRLRFGGTGGCAQSVADSNDSYIPFRSPSQERDQVGRGQRGADRAQSHRYPGDRSGEFAFGRRLGCPLPVSNRAKRQPS